MYHTQKRKKSITPFIITGVFITVLFVIGIVVKEWSLVYEGIGMLTLTISLCIAHRALNYKLELLYLLCFCGLFYTSLRIFTFLQVYPLATFSIIGSINLSHVNSALFTIATSWLGWQSQLSLIHHRYQRRLNSSLGPVTIATLFSFGICYLINCFRLLSPHERPLDDLELLTGQIAGVLIGSTLVRLHVLR